MENIQSEALFNILAQYTEELEATVMERTRSMQKRKCVFDEQKKEIEELKM